MDKDELYTGVFRINEAGLYGIGHFNVFRIMLHLGRPATCISIELPPEKLKELLTILEVNWEDGAYIRDLLVGKLVMLGLTDEHGYARTIGDPYGNKSMEIKPDAKSE